MFFKFLKYKYNIMSVILLFIIVFITLNYVNNKSPLKYNEQLPLIIGVSADYSPFEFMQHGEFKGLDIELAKLIAKHLNRTIKFKDLNFSNLFLALNSRQIDMAISTITFTKERNQQFDLSIPYYFPELVILFRKEQPITKISDLAFKKIGVQLGSTMEIWAKGLANLNLNIISMDLNFQLLESLKSKQLDAIVLEHAQSKPFCNKNQDLDYIVISKSVNGYVIAFKKGSQLLPKVNDALTHIIQDDEFIKLKKKWLELEVEMELNDFN